MRKKIKHSSNKSFGIVFFIVFLVIGFYPIINDGNYRAWALVISLIFLILGLLNSSILTPLNLIWFKFGILLGNIVAPIVMGIIFFFVITPIGITMRLFGKDLLNLKKNSKETYWINKDKNINSMRKQF